MDKEIVAGIVSGILSAIVTGAVSFLLYERKARINFERDIQRVRTEFMAESVVKALLNDPRWDKRSFKEIKKRIGGFSDDELRKILVRAGAVRFYAKNKNDPEEKERWGLTSKDRNLEQLGTDEIDDDA
ncbi:MAG: hypothetical protein AB1648_03245 [Pseudomonadota bacterium]